MGTRLNIEDKDGNELFYGTKFYGYITDIEHCKSVQYLWKVCNEELSKDFDDFEEFCDFFDCAWFTKPMCKMTVPQLMEFVRLYDEDLAEHGWDFKVAERLSVPSCVEFVWLSWC